MDSQIKLFDIDKDWELEWVGMPEYSHKDLKPIKQLIISFESYDDYFQFSELVGQKLTRKTQSIWFPEVKIDRYITKRYSDES